MDNIVIWCADIGSIKNKRFGWCRAENNKFQEGTDILEFCRRIVKDLSEEKKVAIGFECPLFVPVVSNPELLTSARQGESDRAWSAGAGCGALATGLTECAFIFEEIKIHTSVQINTTFNWNSFHKGEHNCFIWEAFVTKSSKVETHSGDARVAVNSFISKYPYISEANSITAINPYNLVAAALLRCELSSDIKLLKEPCIVIKG